MFPLENYLPPPSSIPPPTIPPSQNIEVKMKHLERTPASLPLPDPNVILCGLPWLSGLDTQILTTIQVNASLVHFESDDFIIQNGEDSKGIYIIVSGLVKVRGGLTYN